MEQCLSFERFHPQNSQMVNKTTSFKTKLIGNNDAKANRVNQKYPLMFSIFPVSLLFISKNRKVCSIGYCIWLLHIIRI